MNCLRCGGLVIPHDVTEERETCSASRCLSCGDVVDAVILQHRQHRPEPYSDATLPKFDPAKPHGFPLA